MANTRILKRNNFGKKSLLQIGRGVVISAIAWAAMFGASNLHRKSIEAKAERERAAEIQKEAYKRALERRQLAKEAQKEKDRVGMIKAAKKRGMLPRIYTNADGAQVIVDYIDAPSGEGIRRTKPVETSQADLMRKQLGIKKGRK